MPRSQAERLSELCFSREQKSGRFKAWTSFWYLMNNKVIARSIVREIDRLLSEETDPLGSWDITVESPNGWVGWASIVREDELLDETPIEAFRPNKKTNAYKVSDLNYLAPRTSLITLVFSILRRNGGMMVVVHSVYPGPAVELTGTIDPEDAVFIPFENGGE